MGHYAVRCPACLGSGLAKQSENRQIDAFVIWRFNLMKPQINLRWALGSADHLKGLLVTSDGNT